MLIPGRTCRLKAAVCAPSMPLSQAGCPPGCPRPVQWLLMCAVASALWGAPGGRCLRMADYVRRLPAPRRRRSVLMLPTLDYLPTQVDVVSSDTPRFWSTYGQRRQGLVRRPMEGKNIWRLCKTYGRQIGHPMRLSFTKPRR